MEVYSKHLFDAMNDLGANVDLRKPRRNLFGRPTLRQVLGFYISTCSFLLRRARNYDAVLIGDYAIASLAVMAKAATLGKIRTVVSLHGNDLYFMRKRTFLAGLYRLLSRMVVASGTIEAAIANSGAIKAEAQARGIAPVYVVPLATVVPDTVETLAVPRKRQLLFAGRLIRYKGLSWFIEQVWPNVDCSLELLVAGQVWDEGERLSLQSRERVTYLGTFPYEELPRLRASVLACVMPNLPPGPTEQDEGFGIAALEGPAVGTPTLASHCGGLPDAVAEGVTGFLLPPLDADAWAARINAIAQWSPEEQEAFARGAKLHIVTRYNWRLVAERTLAVLTADPRSNGLPMTEVVGGQSE